MGILQSVIDSAAGRVLATALHTLGAIGMLGGLVGYLAWHRHLRHGHHHANVLAWSSFLAYLAIVVNLVGGFMRTYETGHPGLSSFATEPWVRAIAIKHVFLFVGMAATVYLFEAVAPRLLRQWRAAPAEPPRDKGTGHAIGVLLVTLGIVVAAVLGAVSSVTAIGGDAADDGMDHTADLVAPPRFHNATGQLTSTVFAPATSTGTFDVPVDAADIAFRLTWTPTASNLALRLTGPGGSPAVSPGGSAEGVVGALGDVPEPGTWTYTISSGDPAVSAQWTLALEVPVAPRHTVTIPAGKFYEINAQVPAGGGMAWDWSADGAVAFDVHSHFGGEVQKHAQVDGTRDRGGLEVGQGGGYSYLWENRGTVPVTLTLRVWGDLTVDSVYAP